MKKNKRRHFFNKTCQQILRWKIQIDTESTKYKSIDYINE